MARQDKWCSERGAFCIHSIEAQEMDKNQGTLLINSITIDDPLGAHVKILYLLPTTNNFVHIHIHTATRGRQGY